MAGQAIAGAALAVVLVAVVIVRARRRRTGRWLSVDVWLSVTRSSDPPPDGDDARD